MKFNIAVGDRVKVRRETGKSFTFEVFEDTISCVQVDISPVDLDVVNLRVSVMFMEHDDFALLGEITEIISKSGIEHVLPVPKYHGGDVVKFQYEDEVADAPPLYDALKKDWQVIFNKDYTVVRYWATQFPDAIEEDEIICRMVTSSPRVSTTLYQLWFKTKGDTEWRDSGFGMLSKEALIKQADRCKKLLGWVETKIMEEEENANFVK
jgi:hypothetical protein